MVYGLAVWLPLLDVALSIAAVNMVLLLTIFLASPDKIAKYYLPNVDPGTVDTACMLLELIFLRDGSFRVNLPCFEDDVQFFISHISSM